MTPTGPARPPVDVTITDVTLREHGQNVREDELPAFTAASRASVARGLQRAGIRRLEVFSCVHPRVAPAMARTLIEAVRDAMGELDGVEVVTLVPNLRGYRSFVELGLGGEGLGHTVGLFHSAVEEHNRANLGQSIGDTLAVLRRVFGECRRDANPASAYLSAAFGYREGSRLIAVPDAVLTDQVRRLFDLGARQVTLSDLQGLADANETARIWDLVLGLDGGRYAPRLGYHPHHVDPEQAVARIQAAYCAGVRHFDTSLGATGGCVTGAPGNAPTRRTIAGLDGLGARCGIDEPCLAGLSPGWL